MRVQTLLVGLVFALAGCQAPPVEKDAGTPDAGQPLQDAGTDAGTDGGLDGGWTCSPAELQALEALIASTLDTAAADPNISSIPDLTLLLETNDGRTFSHSHGASSATTSYESASTSKLVSAVIILDAVDHGYLTLGTSAHDLLPFWTETSVTLRHLLSFTSGFSDEPLCINLAVGNFGNCVQTIYTSNSATAAAAGTQFYYSSAHLQVAGLMVMNAKSMTAWSEVVADFKTRTGLLANSTWDLPSATNPRLAGGMHWTAQDYLGFLRALTKGQVLTPAMTAELFANQRGSATVAYSPTFSAGLAEDWAYGLGNWLECPTATTPNSFNCGAGHRNSSPGAYGAYPFIDFDDQYFGILARQGAIGTYPEGVRLFRSVQPLVKQWATRRCGP